MKGRKQEPVRVNKEREDESGERSKEGAEQEMKCDCPIKMCQQKCKDRNRRKEVLGHLLSVSSKTGVFEVAVWLVGTLRPT